MNYDVVVIGGGQAGLAVGYYLRRTGLSYVILDDQTEPGGAWLHTWKSLRLFSPAQWSSLPGVLMAGGNNYYPTRDAAIEYLHTYEEKYNLSVQRPVHVTEVSRRGDHFHLETSHGLLTARAIVSATGSFQNPYTPEFKNSDVFAGTILHSSQYQSPETFRGQRVAIVGEGNSGAQILAEVSQVAETFWITLKEPRFLPDHVDGRFLFDAATQMYEAQKAGKQYKPPSLGDIVMVDSVKEARSRNVLRSLRPFQTFTKDGIAWSDGHEEKIDAAIFCTGFKPSLAHLRNLNVVTGDGKANVAGTQSKDIDGLWLVGYGNWTGFASATLIGVGRSAKKTAEELVQFVRTGVNASQ